MLRELRGVWVGWGWCQGPCELAHVMYASWTSGFGWSGGDVKVTVNLLTSCMLRELRGLGGVGGMLSSLWTCSRHVWFVNFGVLVGWGGMLTSCELAHVMYASWTSRSLGGVGVMSRSLWTCSRHVCFVNFGVWVEWGGMLMSCELAHVTYASWISEFGWSGGEVKVPVNLLTSCMLRELRLCLGSPYIYILYCKTEFTFRYIFLSVYKHVHTYTFICFYCIHTDVHVLLCLSMHIFFLTYVHTGTHIYIYLSHVCFYIYIFFFTCMTCMFLHININYMYIHVYLCMDNLKWLVGECSIALSQAIGQSLPRSLIMAQEQKSTRRKEQKAPKNTSCPRGARPFSMHVCMAYHKKNLTT